MTVGDNYSVCIIYIRTVSNVFPIMLMYVSSDRGPDEYQLRKASRRNCAVARSHADLVLVSFRENRNAWKIRGSNI